MRGATVMLLCITMTICMAFQPSNRVMTRHPSSTSLSMHFDEALKERALETDQLKRERYVATNRFRVRAGKTATFEKRWATRKSRLATLDGFRFFTLLKRVATVGFDKEAPDYEEGNYVSFTIWQDKPSFDAWRTGDAFKEAHGGGKFNLSGFVGLLTTALFIIKGSPKPAFYDGLLSTTDGYLAHSPLLSAANENAEGGWRKVMADGINEIRPEVFVTQDLYSVKEGMKGQFEQSFSTKLKSHKIDFPDMTFAERESQGKGDSSNGDNGMLSFTLLRRDADKADDGVTHAVWRLWTNQAAYDAWKTSFHSPPFLTELTSAPPKTALYEGKLTLFSEQGP